MKTIIFSFAIWFLVGSCSKNNEDNLISQNETDAAMASKFTSTDGQSGGDSETDVRPIRGMYKGIFQRTGMNSSNVILEFTDRTYTGQSDTPQYPAICSYGTYRQSATSVDFSDGCVWKGNFDPSLKMQGTYNVSQEKDGSLRMWRTKGGITDEYKLTPQ